MRRLLSLLVFCLLPVAVQAQSRSFTPPENFSGSKFAARYGLNARAGDFWLENGKLFIRDSVKALPDNPPIMETSESPKTVRDAAIKETLNAANSQPDAILQQAILEALIDQINVLREAAKLKPISSADAIAAIKSKIDAKQ